MDKHDLDKALQFLYNTRERKCFRDEILAGAFNPPENISIDIIIQYLLDEGFILEDVYDERIKSPKQYFISYKGLAFYESSSKKGQPFYSMTIKNKRSKGYNILKTTAIAIKHRRNNDVYVLYYWIINQINMMMYVISTYKMRPINKLLARLNASRA